MISGECTNVFEVNYEHYRTNVLYDIWKPWIPRHIFKPNSDVKAKETPVQWISGFWYYIYYKVIHFTQTQTHSWSLNTTLKHSYSGKCLLNCINIPGLLNKCFMSMMRWTDQFFKRKSYVFKTCKCIAQTGKQVRVGHRLNQKRKRNCRICRKNCIYMPV